MSRLINEVKKNIVAMEQESGLTELMDDVINDDLYDVDPGPGELYGEDEDDDGLDKDLGEDQDVDIDTWLDEQGDATSGNGFGRAAGPGNPVSGARPLIETDEPMFQSRPVDYDMDEEEDEEDEDL